MKKVQGTSHPQSKSKWSENLFYQLRIQAHSRSGQNVLLSTLVLTVTVRSFMLFDGFCAVASRSGQVRERNGTNEYKDTHA